MGDAGLATIAEHSAAALDLLVSKLPSHVVAASGAHYNETVLTFESGDKRDAFIAEARKQDIFAGIPLEKFEKDIDAKHLLVATTEMIEEDDVNELIAAMEVAA